MEVPSNQEAGSGEDGRNSPLFRRRKLRPGDSLDPRGPRQSASPAPALCAPGAHEASRPGRGGGPRRSRFRPMGAHGDDVMRGGPHQPEALNRDSRRSAGRTRGMSSCLQPGRLPGLWPQRSAVGEMRHQLLPAAAAEPSHPGAKRPAARQTLRMSELPRLDLGPRGGTQCQF
ncbi:unnamed protein product [Rangifer tarandus platyrhynchus]|uniref:Uncharacterized protein n=1 Tax=Rangifer tarandus platyrhynchus TaxID=3082113 RepID=A0ABN8ZUG4_RANTA|nr:unnamed protein product [Rangifer tarandus platyrhynchus]